MAEKACPKCSARMGEGAVLDNTYGGRMVSAWLEGKPERSMWVGVKLGGKKPTEITTYRCTGCGFLESYAL